MCLITLNNWRPASTNAVKEDYTYIFSQTGGAVKDWAGAVFLILLQFIMDLNVQPTHKDEKQRQQRQQNNKYEIQRRYSQLCHHLLVNRQSL